MVTNSTHMPMQANLCTPFIFSGLLVTTQTKLLLVDLCTHKGPYLMYGQRWHGTCIVMWHLYRPLPGGFVASKRTTHEAPDQLRKRRDAVGVQGELEG